MENFSLKGKIALITGSSRGIGRAIAIGYAQAGARVVITSRKFEACCKVAKEIKDMGGSATAISCNISSKEEIEKLVEKTEEAFGSVDILVCNAAINPHFGSISRISDEVFAKILQVNVISNNWLMRKVVSSMVSKRNGSIIIIGSIGGITGSKVLGAYCVSKAADIQLARSWALEFGKYGVRANCILPGLIKTDFAQALWNNSKTLKKILENCPINRIGEPEDIVGAALLLASDAGRFITGSSIIVDGGATICGD